MELYKFLGVIDDILEGGRPMIQVKRYDSEGNYIKTHSLMAESTFPASTTPFVSLSS